VLLRPVSGALTVPPSSRATESVQPFIRIEKKTMSNGEQESWSRVKERLRADVGDDVYSSWFARMDLEAIEEGAVRVNQEKIGSHRHELQAGNTYIVSVGKRSHAKIKLAKTG
jgi:tyrosyl-tRNA synthetase